MLHLFNCNGSEFLNQIHMLRIIGDQRDGIGGGFLLAPGMVGKDFFQIRFRNVRPARVCQ
ncbi:hypothetical protein D3C71_1921920 [compost metagenome]